MNTKTLTRNTNERGYTLMEILVAVAIFAVIIMGALLLYDRSNQVFKQSVESSDMQQSTRVAFDKLSADLRMAGFDYDRDGTPFGALASTWKGATAYTSGMLVQPTNPNGHTYICISGGTSAAAEPAWTSGDKDVVPEKTGTVQWQENGDLQYQQPDEQIEYAGRSAVVIRANFNYETATGPCDSTAPCESGREPLLESSEFPVVTTANNEIVAYALKPVKWATGETADDLVFYADTSIPRKANPSTDAKETKITIPGVDLCDKGGCNSPPYTLYRYTVKDDGTPDAGTPVAENIRDVRYRYFTTTSAATADEITTLPNGDGQYDGGLPDATVAGRDTRNTIRAVEVSLTGMNPQPDYGYTNPSDTIAKNYRTLELKSLITPRNAGRRGMKEYNTEAPSAPTIKSICAGACNAVFLTWSAPTTGGDIESYAVLYDTDPCVAGDMPAGGYQYSEEVGLNVSGSVGRYIQPNTNYYFAVQAISKWGAKASKCVGPVKSINRTKPEAPEELIATHSSLAAPYNAVNNKIDLYFTPGAANVDGQDVLACTGGGNLKQDEMPPAEKRYYEVWRSKDINFVPEDSGSVRILEAGSTTQPAALGDYMVWSDTTAASCTDYYYRIRVVDYCARQAAWNESGSKTQGESEWFPAIGEKAIPGYATASAKPKKPTLTLVNANCSGVNCTLSFSWGAVTQNENDEPIAIDKYTLRVYQSSDGGMTFPTAATDTRTIPDGLLTLDYPFLANNPAKFRLTAVGCQPSDESDAVIYPCIFNAGTLAAGISSGSYGGSGTAASPYIIEGATLTATTTNKVNEFRMAVYDATDGSQFATATQAGPVASASFAIPNTPDGRLMRIAVTAVDDKGCSKNHPDIFVSDTAAPACSITDSGTDSSIILINKTNVVFTLKNPSSNDLIIKKVVVKFNAATGDELLSVGFNGTTVNTGCTKTTVVVTAPVGSTVPKTSTSYKLQLNYKDNNLQGANPTTSLCIIYQTPSGDILSCQMHPGAATCTEPASTCQ